MNERIPVMFDRMLRPEWVDYALEQYLASENEADLRRNLHEYLGGQVAGVYTVQKAARQLQRTVGFASPLSRQELEQTYQRLCSLAPSERTAVRLELLIKTTPFLADCVAALRKLKVLGVHGVDLGQMYERLVEKYGDRAMVYRRVRYVLQTLAMMGVVENRDHKWWLTDATDGSPTPPH